jgi:hypothetical protein
MSGSQVVWVFEHEHCRAHKFQEMPRDKSGW